MITQAFLPAPVTLITHTVLSMFHTSLLTFIAIYIGFLFQVPALKLAIYYGLPAVFNGFEKKLAPGQT